VDHLSLVVVVLHERSEAASPLLGHLPPASAHRLIPKSVTVHNRDY
jgi:hypothetical protein